MFGNLDSLYYLCTRQTQTPIIMEVIGLIIQYRMIVNQEMEKENPDVRMVLFYETMIRSLKEDYSSIYCMEN